MVLGGKDRQLEEGRIQPKKMMQVTIGNKDNKRKKVTLEDEYLIK